MTFYKCKRNNDILNTVIEINDFGIAIMLLYLDVRIELEKITSKDVEKIIDRHDNQNNFLVFEDLNEYVGFLSTKHNSQLVLNSNLILLNWDEECKGTLKRPRRKNTIDILAN